MKRFVALVALSAAAGSATAQVESSVGASYGAVRYQDGLSSRAFAVTPSVRYAGPRASAGMSLALLFLADNDWSFQGGPDVRLLTRPLVGRTRLATEAWGSFTARSFVGSSASGAALGEVLWDGPGGSGISVGGGAATGWTSGGEGLVDLRLRARAWTPLGDGLVLATAEPTRHQGAWYTDLSAAAAWIRPAAEVVLVGAVRTASGAPTLGAGTASLRWYFNPGVGLELAGGSYLPDPLQSLPRASFVSLGLRVREPWSGSGRPERALDPPPLAPRRDGDRAVLRFRLPNARRVEIAGEWSDWRPIRLVQVEPGVWEATLELSPGLYQFNLLVDGRWKVPDGVASVPDRYGGRVGVLLVR